jgi:hypothetical protein
MKGEEIMGYVYKSNDGTNKLAFIYSARKCGKEFTSMEQILAMS